MPTVRSTAGGDDDTIGPNSRYMHVVNQSIAHQRRCQIVQDLDARMTRMQIQVMERNAIVQDHRYKRMQLRLRGDLERNLAYKLVVDEHRITGTGDYHKALNTNYTYDALKPEVQRMMQRLKPTYIREQKAKMQLQRSKNAQKVIIERNLDHPSLQTAMERERKEREKQKRESIATGVGSNQDDILRMERDPSDVIVQASGGFLLSRWATAFGAGLPNNEATIRSEKTAVPVIITDSPSSGGAAAKLFKKVGRLAKPKFMNIGIASPQPNKNQKLQPLQTMSLDAKSERSLLSEASSYKKTMSVDRATSKRVRVDDTSAEEDNVSGVIANKEKKKRRKRYTLPPVKVKKGTMGGQNIY